MTVAVAVALTVACTSAPSSPESSPPRAQAPATSNSISPANPINLGRSPLAAVDASSVNGPREMENPYYGVVNAFDDGEHWIKDINYTAWLPNMEEEPYIDVHFDAPVTLTGIEMKAAPGTAFSARLKHADGGESSLASTSVPIPPPPAAEAPVRSATKGEAHIPSSRFVAHATSTPAVAIIELPKPALEVTSVRVQFSYRDQDRAIHELRVMGFPPEGVSFETRTPRIFATERNARLSGTAALEEWKTALFEGMTSEVVERDDAFVITHSKSGKPICRVSVSKTTGRSTTEPLVAGW